MYISDKDHEELYGDKKLAQEMVREQLARKLHCNLQFLNVRVSKLAPLVSVNYKQLAKATNTNWKTTTEVERIKGEDNKGQ